MRQTADIMTDRMRPTIWLIDVRTGQQTPLVATAGSHSQPRWSPDGTRVAYISTAEGGGAQMFVRWIGSGQLNRPEWVAALDQAGYFREWDAEIWLYARDIRLTEHADVRTEVVPPAEN